jgi:hypothetical protein
VGHGGRVYGGDRGLRRDLQARDVGYVLAVAKSHRVSLPMGVLRADRAAARLHRRCWNRMSAGKGAKGDRDYYDWAWVRITPPADETAGKHSLRPDTDDELIPLTVNEIRHLFAKLITNTVRTISILSRAEDELTHLTAGHDVSWKDVRP